MKIPFDNGPVTGGKLLNQLYLSRLNLGKKNIERNIPVQASDRNNRSAKPGINELQLSEVFSITQMAYNVMQKAMEIAMRLSNIAREALVTKSIDYEQLSTVNMEIKNALGQYTQKFNTGIVPIVVGRNEGASIIESPESELNNTLAINKDLEGLRGIADGLLQGNSNGLPELAGITDAIERKSGVLKQFVISIKSGNKLLDINFKDPISKNLPAEAVKNTEKSILNNASDAIKTQGNISHKRVDILINQ